MAGKVWLVGAGPGDPELVTVRGREAIAAAEVVIYDDLVDPEFLEYVDEEAEVLNAAGCGPLVPLAPTEISDLLISRARAGKQVARLLGGDPFVFGPGVAEALALAEAGVAFEVVPGVTSTVAAAAYAGIPILYPGFAQSYAVLSGSAASTAADAGLDWERLSRATDTLVFVSATDNLPALSALLRAHGRPAESPVAVISWATRANQRPLTGTLADIAERVVGAGIRPPALTVVGEVVRLRERLRWYDGRPLFGRRVLLSRSRLGRSALKRLLQADGAEVVELPVAAMVESVPAQLMERMGDALADGQYGWLIFHSPRAVEFFFRQVHDQGRDSRALHASRVVAAGLGTLEALRAYGIRPDVQVEDASPATILEEMTRQGVSRRRVLLPRVEESHQELLDGLRRAGSEVEDMPMFSRAVPRQPDREVAGQLVRGEFDAVVLPAPTAVRNLLRALGGRTEQLAGLPVACLGASTALVARERGLTVAVVADPPTPEALVRLLGEQFQHAGLTAARG